MAGSAADTPAASTGPQFVRVSDADRDQAIDELKQEFAVGRLSHETFMLRIQSALGARDRAQLAGLFTDLPSRRGRLARLRDAVRGWRWRRDFPVAAEVIQRQRYDAGPEQHSPPLAAYPAPELPPAALHFPPGTETSFTIGRDQRCDLCVTHPSVSRLHARLSKDAHGWQLNDLGSTNGTRLNGWRVRAPVPVRPGDLIKFGSASFVVQPLPGGGQPAGDSEGGVPSG